MRKHFFLLAILSLQWILVGCQTVDIDLPEYPLDEKTVISAVEAVGLPWTMSEEDTISLFENQISYSFYAEEEIGTQISSAISGKTRILQMVCGAPIMDEEPEFSWDDWEKQLALASQLFGGFSDDKELFSALSGQEMPESQPLTDGMDGELLHWETELSAAYCVVTWWSTSAYKIQGRISPEQWTSKLNISVYESKEIYEELLET